MNFRRYVMAESLEEAWTLNQKRGNRILGGTLWMKMGGSHFDAAIDLSRLGLDQIEHEGGAYRIGCMATLHDLETHAGLGALTGGAIGRALAPIVGVQFRNYATVGGSVFGRYGFSDVLTVFMAMDAEVMLYRGGRVPIRAFAQMPYDKDILTHVVVRDVPMKIACESVRLSKTDFPVLTCAVSEIGGKIAAVVGARPNRARAVDLPEGAAYADFPALVADALDFGSNMRGSAAYRKHLCRVLVGRCITGIGGDR